MNQQEPTMQQECMNQEMPPHTSEEEISKAIEQEHKAILEHEPKDESPLGKTFQALIEEMKQLSDPEKKLERAIRFMEEALSQSGIPHFKEFWEVRRLSLDLFKETINPSARMSLWTKYSELCRQARKLKEIFDEQSAFAAEQIEIAVSAIENEIVYLVDLLAKMPDVNFGVESKAIAAHLPRYNELQRELNLLNTYAVKTNALRKELIKTEMRIRAKNKFFERLSKLGDAVFPRRKQLIQEVSELFVNDVNSFIQSTFVTELKTQALFDAREEIKALQSIAKTLTLNTEAFSQTRRSLSECWDSIKNVVKERRKEETEQRASYKKHRDEFHQELEALKAKITNKEIQDREAEHTLEDIIQRMRKTPLGKFEIRELRECAKVVREELSAKMQALDDEKKKEARKKEHELKERFSGCKERLQTLLAGIEQGELDTLAKQYEEAIAEIAANSFTRQQKQELETLIRKIKDGLNDKRENALLSDDQRVELGALEEILEERHARRQEIKSEIDALKKLQGSSGLDISQAMQYNELMATHKERLEKIEAGIHEIEEKIDRLQA